jgi:hypothetical protein
MYTIGNASKKIYLRLGEQVDIPDTNTASTQDLYIGVGIIIMHQKEGAIYLRTIIVHNYREY